MTDKNYEVVAVVKPALRVSNTNYSHVYIDFYRVLSSEVDEAVNTEKMFWVEPSDTYAHLNINNQYGSDFNDSDRTSEPYGYKLAASVNEADPETLNRVSKLLSRVSNRTAKLLSTEDKDSNDPYRNYVSKVFKAMKVKRAVLISQNTLKWYDNAHDAVYVADSKIRVNIEG